MRNPSMTSRRLLTLGPDNEPLWVRVYVQQIGDSWAAMIMGDDVSAPGPGELKGVAFFGDTLEEAEGEALEYLGQSEPAS